MDVCAGCVSDCLGCPVTEEVIMHCPIHGDYQGNGCLGCFKAKAACRYEGEQFYCKECNSHLSFGCNC